MQILSSLPSIIDINAVLVKLCDSDRGPGLLRHGVDSSPTRQLNFTIIYCVLAIRTPAWPRFLSLIRTVLF